MDESFGTDVLGHEIGVLAQSVAGALDLDDHSMVQQAIQQGGGDDGIAEHLAPFGKAAVRGQDHGTAFVAGVDQLKEQVATAGDDRQVADFIDDQQGKSAIEADLLAQDTLTLGLGQRADQVGQVEECTLRPALTASTPRATGKVALAGARRPDEVNHLGAVDELQLSQGEDPVAVERGLEREVEAGKRLDVGQLAITSDVLMRLLSRSVNSSASIASIASSALTSPRSSCCTMTSTISSALGMRKPTRVALMRSTTEGMSSARALIMRGL